MLNVRRSGLGGRPRRSPSNDPSALKGARQTLTSKINMSTNIGRRVGLIEQVQGSDDKVQALGHQFE